MIPHLKVTLRNQPGTLKAMTDALAQAKVDIKALDVSARSERHGEAHLIVDHADRARSALEDLGLTVAITDAVVVEMDDQVGGLAKILAALAADEINVEHLYAFVGRVQGKSLAVLQVQDPQRAKTILTKAQCRVFERHALEDAQTPPQDDVGPHLGLDYIW